MPASIKQPFPTASRKCLASEKMAELSKNYFNSHRINPLQTEDLSAHCWEFVRLAIRKATTSFNEQCLSSSMNATVTTAGSCSVCQTWSMSALLVHRICSKWILKRVFTVPKQNFFNGNTLNWSPQIAYPKISLLTLLTSLRIYFSFQVIKVVFSV